MENQAREATEAAADTNPAVAAIPAGVAAAVTDPSFDSPAASNRADTHDLCTSDSDFLSTMAAADLAQLHKLSAAEHAYEKRMKKFQKRIRRARSELHQIVALTNTINKALNSSQDSHKTAMVVGTSTAEIKRIASFQIRSGAFAKAFSDDSANQAMASHAGRNRVQSLLEKEEEEDSDPEDPLAASLGAWIPKTNFFNSMQRTKHRN